MYSKVALEAVSQVLDTSDGYSSSGDILGSFTDKTLTLDLQSGSVAATADAARRLGFICEGEGEAPCATTEEQIGTY